jgi:hypothetical protein
MSPKKKKENETIKTEIEHHPSRIATTTATPVHTYDWYVKWIASIILLFAMTLTANNIYPLNLYFHLTGLAGWLVVSIMWNDRALIMINSAALAIFFDSIFEVHKGLVQ